MDITKSLRKRAGRVITDEYFTSPSFEAGNKSVPEAELEHVSPLEEVGEVILPDFKGVSQPQSKADTETIKNQVSQVVGNIGSYTEQISDLVARVDAERENLRKILSQL